MTTLGGAVALEEVHHVTVAVGEHLDLDVAARLDVLLDDHGVVAEGRAGLASGGGDRVGVLTLAADDPHPLATATGSGLDEHREVEARRIGLQVVGRDDGDPGGHGDLTGVVLAAHLLHHLGAGADEDDPGVLEGPREGGALGEEAVAGMDRVRPRRPGGPDDRVDVEVGLDRDGLVGVVHVGRGAVEPEWTAIVWIPMARADRMIRHAISPRLAIRSLAIIHILQTP